MSLPDKPRSERIEGHIDRAAKITSNIKTLLTAVISAFGVVFAAGVYYNDLKHKLDDYTSRIDQIQKNDIEIQSKYDRLKNSINMAFTEAARVQNVRNPFRNTEPYNAGGGLSADVYPGRCQDGEVVVGIAPYKDGNGVRSIDIQCGKISTPHIK